MKIFNKWQIYSLDSDTIKSRMSDIAQAELVSLELLNTEHIDRFFSKDEKAVRIPFEKGDLGFIILTPKDDWVCVGFLTKDLENRPIQIAYSDKKFCDYWIFNCETNFLYRGRGYYKLFLLGVLRWISESLEQNIRIGIDTQDWNKAAIRAIESSGFEFVGTITNTRIPRFGWKLNWIRKMKKNK